MSPEPEPGDLVATRATVTRVVIADADERTSVVPLDHRTGVNLFTERWSFVVTTSRDVAEALRPGDVVDVVLRRVAQ